ncbi:MAG: alpha/beta hydrolase [Oscillospiraceae bacterium]|nr:alpha/beta hydrolase [Oscillospiraceae bacterium]
MIKEQLYEMYLPYPGRGDRLIRVFVPEHGENEKLPVVYMPDGQSIFDDESSAFGSWHTREAVRDERKRSGRAAIIVGIHTLSETRANELTPATIGKIYIPEDMPFKIEPEGEVFCDFVIKTVMPAVEARFPVLKGRENTAFCGSSSGGLICFFIVMSHPELFSAAGVLSPAFLGFAQEDMRLWIERSLREDKPFFYFYSGAEGELEKLICESERWTFEIMRERYPKKLLKELIVPGAIHHESAWEPVFRDFLSVFLGTKE